jgi:hypothetical protein
MQCTFCDRATEIVLAGEPICEECHEKAGSCCLEFGGEDLWQRREREPGKEEQSDRSEEENRGKPATPFRRSCQHSGPQSEE